MGFPVVKPQRGFFNFNDAIHLQRFENRRLLQKPCPYGLIHILTELICIISAFKPLIK